MKKALLIPDSFKGSMPAREVCIIMEKSIRQYYPNTEIISIPVADGGEGSVDCFLSAVGGEKIFLPVQGVFGDEMIGYYGLLQDGKTAIVEMACCAGLPLAEGRFNPKTATTYGVGQLILAAAQKGVKRIIVGLGGSATNDGGCGAASAVGVRFFEDSGNCFVPTGGTLKNITRIDASAISPSLQSVEIVAMCDIDNPMYGKSGAAYVFAPQKGADSQAVAELDEGLRHLAHVIKKDLGKDVSTLPGGGAAGAMGAGMYAFFSAELKMGIDVVLDTIEFDKKLKGADLVFTGEGKIDKQSLHGKAVIGVARRAKQQSIPVIAVVGDIGEGAEGAYKEGVTAIFSTNNLAVDFDTAKKRAHKDLEITMDNIMRFYGTIHNNKNSE